MFTGTLPPPPPLPFSSGRIILVTYDLKTPGKDYTSLFEVLKQQGQWWHYMASVWLIYTVQTPSAIYSAIVPHITIQDYILISTMERPYWGLLPKDAWDWIAQRGLQP